MPQQKTKPFQYKRSTATISARTLVAAASELASSPLFEAPKVEESTSEFEPSDPDFYRIGYARSVRDYGVEFMEGPNGFGVYASCDVEPLRRARNPWDVINSSGNSKIHLDTFLSVYTISDLPDEFCYNELASELLKIIAAARTLPIPSIELKAAKELQEECHIMLQEFPTTSDQDQKILGDNS